MKNQFWLLVFDGNMWISYSNHDTYGEAKKMADDIRFIRWRITLVIEDQH